MNKYLLFFKNSISEALIYRSHIFMLIISQAISLFVFVFLWKAIYAEGNQIGGYSLNSLISYYILSAIISFVIQGVDVAWRIGDEIRLGNITNFILKPINYFWSTFWIVAGKSFLNLLISFIIMVPIILFSTNFFIGSLDFVRLGFFAISIFFAFIIFVLFFYIIGLVTFWLGDAKGLNFLIRMCMFFLAGNIVPLDLLPKIISNINNFLPFRFITWFPIAIWSGKVELNLSIFIPALIWIMILGVLANFIFKKGLEKYEGQGA
ncbi:MAG: ABC-2 family transporter protein [bacterium]|nr:ABC-2 family transporter protein [bacterium]